VDDKTQPSTSLALNYKFTNEEPGDHTISVRAKDALEVYSFWKDMNLYLHARVATPTFKPTSGTYSSPQSVTINCATKDAVIRFTTDGSTPTASSTPYSDPITKSSTTTIKAKAFKDGMTENNTASAIYTINTPTPTPIVTPTPTPPPTPAPESTQIPSPQPTGIGAFYFPPKDSTLLEPLE
jgi:hypothetical protein